MLSIKEPYRRRDASPHYGSVIASIGRTLGAYSLPNAQRMALKRYGRHREAEAECIGFRLLSNAGTSIATMSNREVRSWLWLVHCMALLSGPDRDPHSVSIEAAPGRVLQHAGYSEFSLGRLLDSRGDTFNLLLERAVLRIARAREAVNWTKLAPLLLASDPESAWAESARLTITHDYVRASHDRAFEQEQDGAPGGTVASKHLEYLDA